jgi:long-chain acyl-CoA synthetase
MQVERVKAYVVLKEPALASADTERALIEHCRLQLIKWSCPREIEFRGQLPTTRIGKIDYKKLVQEHISQHENRGSA